MFKPKTLTVPYVFQCLTEIAKATGNAVCLLVCSSLSIADWINTVSSEESRHHQKTPCCLPGYRGEIHHPISRRKVTDRSCRQNGRGCLGPRYRSEDHRWAVLSIFFSKTNLYTLGDKKPSPEKLAIMLEQGAEIVKAVYR